MEGLSHAVTMKLRDENLARLSTLVLQVSDKLRREKPSRESANVCKRL